MLWLNKFLKSKWFGDILDHQSPHVASLCFVQSIEECKWHPLAVFWTIFLVEVIHQAELRVSCVMMSAQSPDDFFRTSFSAMRSFAPYPERWSSDVGPCLNFRMVGLSNHHLHLPNSEHRKTSSSKNTLCHRIFRMLMMTIPTRNIKLIPNVG